MNGILYFSSTGNSLYIAKKLKQSLSGNIIYIPKYNRDASEWDNLFIVSPIYSFGLPIPVLELMQRIDKTIPVTIILNYGGMSGGADYLAYMYAKNKFNLNIKSVYKIKMTENFTLQFSVPRFYQSMQLKKCNKRIDKVITAIISGKNSIPKKQRTKEKAYLKNKSNWHIIGERFSASNDCTLCGKCVNLCPVNNISIKDGKVVFGNNCIACLGCYHRCPNKAIKYLNKNKKYRYINPFIKEDEIGKDL